MSIVSLFEDAIEMQLRTSVIFFLIFCWIQDDIKAAKARLAILKTDIPVRCAKEPAVLLIYKDGSICTSTRQTNQFGFHHVLATRYRFHFSRIISTPPS